MKKRKTWCGFLMIASAIVMAAYAWADVTQWADLLMTAHKENQPIPLLSDRFPEMDEETAYSVQKAYVQQRLAADGIAGFKAGLTSEAGQKKFGTKGPVAGVLFTSGKKTDSPIIDNSSFKRLMIEVEIAFVAGKVITEPLKDVSELKESIRGVAPAVEFPDLGFADIKKLRGTDLIAADVAAAQFIVGKEADFRELAVNDLSATLTLDGQVVNEGKASDASGDQWKAALWLVNTMVEQGWKIEPGQVLLTGALGNMLPGKPGKYSVDIGSLGAIQFEVR